MTIKEILLRTESNTEICIDLNEHEGSSIFTICGKLKDLAYTRIKEIEDKQIIRIGTLKKLDGTPSINIVYED